MNLAYLLSPSDKYNYLFDEEKPMNHYVYITFNNLTKEYYIGGRSTELNPHLDKYLGSGTRFKEEYKKDKTIWDKYILSEHETIEELRAAEYDAIKGHIGNEKCLNMRLAASRAAYGLEHTTESKEKMRLGHVGKKRGPMTNEHRENMRLAKLGKKKRPMTDEAKEHMRLARLGKKYHHTNETKEKMRLAKLGKKLGPYKKKERLK